MCVCVCVCVFHLQLETFVFLFFVGLSEKFKHLLPFSMFLQGNQDCFVGIYISSSSYRAGSTDIPDPLSPLLPIVHRPR